MNLRIRKSAITQYFLIYVLICFQGSLAFRYYNVVFIIIAFFAATYVGIKKYKQIPKHYILFLIVLTVSLIMEMFLTDGGVYLSSIASILARFCIILAAFWYMEEKFVERFVKMTIFLATISLIGFSIVSIAPTILKSLMVEHKEIMSTYWSTYTVSLYGGVLFAFSSATARNIGIFHEPGLYQIVLNSALYLMLFKREKLNITNKKYNMFLFILIITLLSTMSTTGIIGMIALFCVYLVFYRDKSNRKIKWLILAVIICAIIISYFAGDSGYLNKYVFSKIFSTEGHIDFSNSTGSSRILSLISDLSIFRQHLFGIGYANYNNEFKKNLLDKTISDTSSCVGLTQVLAILGIVIFVVIISYYIYLMKKNLTTAQKIGFIILFINTSLAQPYIWFPAIVVLLFVRENLPKERKFELSKSNK